MRALTALPVMSPVRGLLPAATMILSTCDKINFSMNATDQCIMHQRNFNKLTRWSLLFAGGVLVTGIPWIRWVQGRNVWDVFLGPAAGSAAGYGLLVGVGMAVLIWPVFRHLPSAQAVLHRLDAVLGFGRLSAGDIVLISLSAGVGEEVLFRGVLQPDLGLWFTAVVFGLLHPLSWWYVVYATGAGLVLGGLVLLTEGLLASIVCHTVVDTLLLWRARVWASRHPPVD